MVSAHTHRLGGHEAPPAIISAYLGDHVNAAVEQYIKVGGWWDLAVRCARVTIAGRRGRAQGNTSAIAFPTHVRLGQSLPQFEKHTSDRNRTSPFAFTGALVAAAR